MEEPLIDRLQSIALLQSQVRLSDFTALLSCIGESWQLLSLLTLPEAWGKPGGLPSEDCTGGLAQADL